MRTVKFATFFLCLFQWNNPQTLGFLFDVPDPIDPFFGRGELFETIHNIVTNSNPKDQNPNPNPNSAVDSDVISKSTTEPESESSQSPFNIIGIYGPAAIGKTQFILKYIQLLRMQQTSDDPEASSSVPHFKNFIHLDATTRNDLEKSLKALASHDDMKISLFKSTEEEKEEEEKLEKSIEEIGAEINEKICGDLNFIAISLDLNENFENEAEKNISNFLLPVLPNSHLNCVRPTIFFLITSEIDASSENQNQNGNGNQKTSTATEMIQKLLEKRGLDSVIKKEQLIQIPRFLEHENSAFILQRLRYRIETSQQNKKDAAKLGEVLQGFPMALNHAVCFMEQEDSQNYAVVEIQEYVQKYVQLQLKTEKIQLEKEKEKGQENPVYYTFHLSLNKLKGNEEDSTAVQILESLAFFPAQNIKIKLLAGILNETEVEIEKSIQQLEKFGLVQIPIHKSPEENFEALSIHRKIQSLMLKNMEENEKVKIEINFLLSRSIEFLDKNQSSVLLEQMEEICKKIEKYSRAKDADFETTQLSILGLKTRISIRRRSNRVKNLLAIFQILKDQNTFESDKEMQNEFVKIFLPSEISREQIVEIQELASDILGEYHPFYLKLLQNFVEASLKRAEYPQAIETTEKILRILEDSPRKNMTLILDTMFKMAEMQVLSNNTGDAVEAFLDLFEKEQEHIIVVSTERKFRTLGAIYNFSMDLAHSGNFEPALKLLNKLYKMQQPKTKSKSDDNSNSNPISETPQNPAILSTLHHIATIKFLEKKYEESLNLFTQVVKSRIKSLGRNHKGTLKSIEGKASALFRLGRYDDAQALYTQVNEVRSRGKEKTREENLDLASTRYNMARVLIYQGQGQTQEEGKERLAESLKLFLEAYEIQNNIRGPENSHPQSLKTLEHICILNVTIGTENEATLGLAGLYMILDLRKFEYGEDDERSLATSVALALGLLIVNHKIDLGYLPQGDSAVFDFLKKVYQTRKEKEKEKSDLKNPIIPDFEPTDTLNTFAHILLSLQGRKKGKGGIQGKVKTLDMLTSVHSLQEKILGSSHTETMLTLGHRIQLMILQGNSEDGLKLASDLISKNKEKLRKKKREKQKRQEQEKDKGKKGEKVTSDRDLNVDLDLIHETTENLNLAIITSMELLLRFYNQAPNLYYQEAVILHKDIHELKKAHFGENHGQTLTTLVSLAQLHTKLGDWSSAEKIYGDVYKMRKRTLGEEHVDTLEALHQSALARLKQKKLEDAFTLFKQLYESHKKISGEYSEQTLYHLYKMAEIRESQGIAKEDKSLLKESLKLYAQVQKRREKTLGDDHNETLSAIQSLIRVHTHSLLQNTGEALKLLKKVYEGQKRSIGGDHLDTLVTLKKMADLFTLQKNYEKAAKFLKRVFRSRRGILGPLHKEVISVQEELATLHYTMGHMDDAEDAYLQLYELKKKNPSKWGPEHPDTLNTLEKLASLAKEIKNYDESFDLYKKVWAGRKKSLGEEHEDFIQTTEILAGLYLGFGDEEESEKLRRLVYNIRRRLLGKENAKTVEAEKNLAMVYLEQHASKERKEKGLKLLENVYRWQKKSLGEEHPETQSTDQTIKYIKEQLGLNKKEKEDL